MNFINIYKIILILNLLILSINYCQMNNLKLSPIGLNIAKKKNNNNTSSRNTNKKFNIKITNKTTNNNFSGLLTNTSTKNLNDSFKINFDNNNNCNTTEDSRLITNSPIKKINSIILDSKIQTGNLFKKTSNEYSNFAKSPSNLKSKNMTFSKKSILNPFQKGSFNNLKDTIKFKIETLSPNVKNDGKFSSRNSIKPKNLNNFNYNHQLEKFLARKLLKEEEETKEQNNIKEIKLCEPKTLNLIKDKVILVKNRVKKLESNQRNKNNIKVFDSETENLNFKSNNNQQQKLNISSILSTNEKIGNKNVTFFSPIHFPLFNNFEMCDEIKFQSELLENETVNIYTYFSLKLF